MSQEEEVKSGALGSGIPAPGDAGIPDEQISIPSGIPDEQIGIPSGIPEEKPTTAKVRQSTKTMVAGMKMGDESFDDTVRRISGEHTTLRGRINELTDTNDHLTESNTKIREILAEEQRHHQEQFDEHVGEIAQLQARITTLEATAETAVVTTDDQEGMNSIGIKDVIEEARDVCGDDETCNKVIGKMIDLRAHFASKTVDHGHAAEQNRLDREQKEADRKFKQDQAEKDRKFKQDQAERERYSKIELALAKKGGFKKEFLDDVVFLGGGSPKRPGKEIERRKQQARAAAEDEEDWSDPTAEEEELPVTDDPVED